MKKADHAQIVNIRDKNGKSTWPTKNTEEAIDRVLKTISYRSAQKEYFNNPISEGTVFTDLYYDRVPKLSTCEKVAVYADPSPSNNTRTKSSRKSVGIIAYKNGNIRSEEHTSELQSRGHLVCRLLLEKKNF